MAVVTLEQLQREAERAYQRDIRNARTWVASTTHLADQNLNIAHTRALNFFLGELDKPFYQNDTLIGDGAGPFNHLLRDFVRGDNDECLDGIGSLAKVEKHHLATLCTGSADTRTEKDNLAFLRWDERCDGNALSSYVPSMFSNGVT